MPLLLILLVVLPIVELYVIIQVGQSIGVLWTIALLVADSIVGGVLMRSQGRRVWQRFAAAMSEGRVPAKETLDGALVIFGGAFLLTPGFVTDIFGFALLAPPTRAVIRATLLRQFSSRLTIAVRAGRFASGRAPGAGHGTPAREGDVEGTAHEVDPRALERDGR